MSEGRPEFDLHPSIRYCDLMQRVQGRYICKVALAGGWNMVADKDWLAEQGTPTRLGRGKLVSPDRSWLRVCNGWGTFYLFEKEANALDFVERIGPKHIASIHRPPSAAESAEMAGDHRTVIRNAPYFNNFYFAVHLKVPTDHDVTAFSREVGKQLSEFFGGDCARYRLTSGIGVRVYLINEKDIVLVRLAFSELVTRIERVLLRGLLSSAERTGADACPQGGDPPRN